MHLLLLLLEKDQIFFIPVCGLDTSETCRAHLTMPIVAVDPYHLPVQQAMTLPRWRNQL